MLEANAPYLRRMLFRKPHKEPKADPLPKSGPVTEGPTQPDDTVPGAQRRVETDQFLRKIKPEDKAGQSRFEEKAKQVLDLAENSPEEMSSLIHVWLAQGRQDRSGPEGHAEDGEPGPPSEE